MPKQGDLKVWWIPQVPGRPFEVLVDSVKEAALLLDSLARYDIFQLAQKIKPDFSNAGGLVVFDEEEWIDWEDQEEFIDINEWMRLNETRKKQNDVMFDIMSGEKISDE